MWNKRNRSSALEIETLNLGNLEVPFPLKKRSGTERSTTPIRIIPRCAKKSSVGSRLQHLRKANVVELFTTMDVIKKMTGEAKKTPEDRLQSTEAESSALGNSGFNN